MYSKDQVKELKQAFWTKLGQYMALQLSAESTPINWINYRTGIRNLQFKMEAGKDSAFIGIVWNQKDDGIRNLMSEQFLEYKTILHGILGEEWIWEFDARDDYGAPVARIYILLDGKSIFKQEDWSDLIGFYKPRMMALDEFWSDVKYNFDIFK